MYAFIDLLKEVRVMVKKNKNNKAKVLKPKSARAQLRAKVMTAVSDVKNAIKRTVKQQVKKQGYVTTVFGRRRSFDLRTTRGNRFLESEMERMAVNAIIQGTDADIMKQAMILVHKEFSGAHVRPILQIHDEMIYEILDKELEKTIPKMKKIMEQVASLSVPLTVAVKTGKQWGCLVHRP